MASNRFFLFFAALARFMGLPKNAIFGNANKPNGNKYTKKFHVQIHRRGVSCGIIKKTEKQSRANVLFCLKEHYKYYDRIIYISVHAHQKKSIIVSPDREYREYRKSLKQKRIYRFFTQHGGFLLTSNSVSYILFYNGYCLVGEVAGGMEKLVAEEEQVEKKVVQINELAVDNAPEYRIYDSDPFYAVNLPIIGDIAIENLDFSVRLYNGLARAKLRYLKDVLFLTESQLLRIRNLGRVSINELILKTTPSALSKLLLSLKQAEINKAAYIEPENRLLHNSEMSARAYNALKQNQLLNEFDFLSLTNEQILELRNVGISTAEELIDLRESKLETNVDFFVRKLKGELQGICKENHVFDIVRFVSERAKKVLSAIGVTNIEQLKNMTEESIKALLEIRDEISSLIQLFTKSIISTLCEEFEWCLIHNNSGKNKEKEAERNIKLLYDRAKGLNLTETGNKYSLTRERVRQIENKRIKRFDALLRKSAARVFFDHIFKDVSYVFSSDIAKPMSYGEIFVYLLKKSAASGLVYIDELDAFIFGENWFIEVERFIDELPQTITRIALNAEMKKLFESLKEKGITFRDKDISDIVTSNYKVNGEFLTRVNITLLAKYKTVLERYFQDGINVYNDLDLERFRSCYNKLYDDRKIAGSDRALVMRIVDNCILIDRGRYALKKESYISKNLLDTIFDYIISSPRDIIMTNEIFHKYERQLVGEGVRNKYFIQGILKQHNTFGLFITRDYISKSKEKSNIYKDVSNYILRKKGVVNIAEIKNEFPVLPDSVFSIVLSEYEIVSVWNKNYIHRDNIDFYEQDEFYTVLKELVEREKLVSDNRVFDLAKKKFEAFVENNRIETPFYLFSILKSFFCEKFRFCRPYIIDESLDIANGVDLIRQHFSGRDVINVAEIKSFVREKDIAIYSFIDLINSLNGFLWADKETIVSSSKVKIDDETIRAVEQVITNRLSEKGYAEIAKLDMLSSLPSVDIEWTDWLVYSIVMRYSANFEVATSSNFYNSAVPIIMKIGINADFARE
ncbi:MAG: hypothetical protein LBQ40_04590 [Clostridiales bacterium]|nr:hypothetical protein [Clostridiales bacterium]